MSAASEQQQRRPIQLLFRSKEAVELYTLPDTSTAATFSPPSSNTSGGQVLYKGKTTFHLLSPNGNCAFIHDASVGLLKCDLTSSTAATTSSSNSSKAFLENSKSIQLAKCSPRGSFLLTWERPSKDDSNNNNNNGNLKVWDANTGTLLTSYSCKKATLSTVQWTYDEQFAFHCVTNEIHVYSTNNWKVRVGKIRCEGVSSFSLPVVKGVDPTTNNSRGEEKYLLTVFVPGIKGKPARVDLLRYPDRMGRDSSTTTSTSTTSDNNNKTNIPSGPALTSKSLFNAEEVNVKWSPRADSALLLTQTAVDNTGQSYYGSTHLFLLLESDVKNPTQGCAIVVPLPKEATKDMSGVVPIVSADWIPNPSITGVIPFGVISGRMPALSSLHHGITGEPTFLFGRAHRNTMDVSPHGRFIVCGGYGNLAGGMDFWDRNKCKLIPRRVILKGGSSSDNGGDDDTKYVTIKEASDLSTTSSSPVVGHQWSPDSRTYLVSTTSPRMNVENGVQIHRYDGSLVDESVLPWDNANYRPDKLLSAEYVPAPLPSKDDEFYYYPDRPQSPAPRRFAELKGDAAVAALSKLRDEQSSAQSSGSGQGGSKAATPSAGAYVPPAARRAGAGGGGGAYVPPGARKGAGGRGGGTSLAERMRQEREGSAATVSGVKVTKRTGPVGAASVAGPVGSSSNADADGGKSKSAMRREKQRLAKEKAEKEAAEEEKRQKEIESARAAANKADPEKRAKKIRKTLKQIDEIKSKAASGTELNDDQKAKLATEEELRQELASLNLN
jgi:translation initiation factor 2A